jgi:hypothetical protein
LSEQRFSQATAAVKGSVSVKITLEMIEAARQAEFQYYAQRQILAVRSTPDPVIRAMLEAAFAQIPDEVAATVKPAVVVTARKPKPRR